MPHNRMTKPTSPLTRRRFIGIMGFCAGVTLLPFMAHAKTQRHQWSGVALGARASMQLIHPDAATARHIIHLAVQEIERLEAVFSLYRHESALSKLNREGHLSAPPLELVELLQRAKSISHATNGLFDITVQPLWQRYHRYYSAHPDAETPPPVDDILPLINWRAVRIDPACISFDKPGMAITLNGIAQGYITDRVADLLKRNGIDRVLLDLGETRAMGLREDGRAWAVGVADPQAPARISGHIECVDRAVATSGGYGLIFDAARRVSHLLNPHTGATLPAARSITVVADQAATADAWSTAFSLMKNKDIIKKAAQIDHLAVYQSDPVEGLKHLA